MKNITKFTIMALAITLFFGCKKGENDPFLSLKSRDARITGEWELVKSDRTSSYTNTGQNSFFYSYNYIFDGTTLTTIITSSQGTETTTKSYAEKLSIQKNGKYIETYIEDEIPEIYDGIWWWTNDSKKKTRIALGHDYDSYLIDRLTNKELIIKTKYSSVSSDGQKDEWEATKTFKKI
jgi:hypothetical protein